MGCSVKVIIDNDASSVSSTMRSECIERVYGEISELYCLLRSFFYACL